MEVSGLAFRQHPCFSSNNGHRWPHDATSSTSSSLCLVSMGRRREANSSSSSSIRYSYSDNGHLRYYHVRCGDNKNYKEKQPVKKQLKLVKTLSKDLAMFSHNITTGFPSDPHNNTFSLLDQERAMLLQETAQGLMQQLQELRAKDKELKRKKKAEKKNKLKPSSRMIIHQSESSSSSESSDSQSDSDGGEVIEMTSLRYEAALPPPPAQPQPTIAELHQLSRQQATLAPPILPTQDLNTVEDNTSPVLDKQSSVEVEPSTNTISVCCNARNSSLTGIPSPKPKRIEVCMGSKCKKSGGAELLEEFQRVLGVEDAVVGCKCMGKCKNGPNVKVMNSVDDRNIQDDSVRTPAIPLCIGVGLEDVDVIVANFLAEDKRLGLAPAS